MRRQDHAQPPDAANRQQRALPQVDPEKIEIYEN